MLIPPAICPQLGELGEKKSLLERRAGECPEGNQGCKAMRQRAHAEGRLPRRGLRCHLFGAPDITRKGHGDGQVTATSQLSKPE